MILLFRKYLVRLFISISLAFVLFGVFYYFKYQPSSGNSFAIANYQLWWMLYSVQKSADTLRAWISLMGLGLYSLVFGFFIYRQIRKNPSAQLAFLYLFIFSISLSLMRIFPLLPEGDIPFHQLDKEIITRITYFGRLFGLSSFFAASLFVTGIQIQKFGMILLINTLVSFTISIILPFNTTILTSALLYRVGEEKSLAFFCLTLEILTVLNYFSTAVKHSRNELYRIMFFTVLMLTGFEMVFFIYFPLYIPGIMLLILGTFFYMRTSQKLFLWS